MGDVKEVITFLGSVSLSAAVLLVIAWFLKDYLTGLIAASVRHPYDMEIETLRAELQRSTSEAVERFRAEHDVMVRTQVAVVGSAAAGQSAAFLRRIEALEAVWNGILQLRQAMPTALGFAALLPRDSLAELIARPANAQWRDELDLVRMLRPFRDAGRTIESRRVFLGEYPWSIYIAYNQLLAQACVVLHRTLVEDEPDAPWVDDDPTVERLLRAALTQEEWTKLAAMPTGRVFAGQRLLEEKFLLARAALMTGQLSANEMLDTARRIQKVVADAKAASPPGSLGNG